MLSESPLPEKSDFLSVMNTFRVEERTPDGGLPWRRHFRQIGRSPCAAPHSSQPGSRSRTSASAKSIKPGRIATSRSAPSWSTTGTANFDAHGRRLPKPHPGRNLDRFHSFALHPTCGAPLRVPRTRGDGFSAREAIIGFHIAGKPIKKHFPFYGKESPKSSNGALQTPAIVSPRF